MAEQVGQYVTTNLNQSVQTLPDVSLNGGRMRVVADHMASTDAAQNDTIWMARLPSNVRILPISRIHHDDMGTGVTFDIGTFNPSGKSGITDDDNSINDGIDVATAAGTGIALFADWSAKGFKRLWEIAGASADPKQEIDIKITIKDADPGAGDVAWEICYVID